MATGVATCTACNDLLHLRCDRERGHEGSHMQIDDNGTRAWGFFGGKPEQWLESLPEAT